MITSRRGAITPLARLSTQRMASSSSSSSSTAAAATPAAALPPIARSEPLLYASLVSPPSSQLHAILARLGLPVDDTQVLSQLAVALTHPSWIPQRDEALRRPPADLGTSLHSRLQTSRERQETGQPQSHAELATLGNSLLGILASENLHLNYPNLPNRVLKAALSALVGPQTLADVAAEMGLGAKGVVRWDRDAVVQSKVDATRSRQITSREVLAGAMRAVVALIFQVKVSKGGRGGMACSSLSLTLSRLLRLQGMAAVRSFVSAHLLSRVPLPPLNAPPATSLSPSPAASSSLLAPLLKFSNPKRSLSLLCAKHGLPTPTSRLIAETGRLSNAAVFGVGVYVGTRRVGEGWGSQIRMAEFRAAEDAMRRVMLANPVKAAQSRADEPTGLAREEVPSATLDHIFGGAVEAAKEQDVGARDIWAVGEESASSLTPVQYRPRPLGESELVFGSKA